MAKENKETKEKRNFGRAFIDNEKKGISRIKGGLINLFKVPILFLAQMLATLVYRIVYGKNWAEELRRNQAMKEAIKNVKNEKEKVSQDKEQSKDKEQNKTKIFQKIVNQFKTPTNEELVEKCTAKFQNQKLDDILKDPKKSREFIKLLDPYLDNTLPKDSTKEYELTFEKGMIKIYEKEKETEENKNKNVEKKLLYGMNADGIYTPQGEAMAMDKTLYNELLNFADKSKISFYPTVEEFQEVMIENANKVKRGETRDFMYKGVNYRMEKGKDDKVNLYSVVNAISGEHSIVTSNVVLIAQNINVMNQGMTEKIRCQLVGEMQAEIENLREIERKNKQISEYEKMSLKDAAGKIAKEFGYTNYQVDLYKNEITFIKEIDEFTDPATIVFNKKGEVVGSSEYIDEKKLEKMKDNLECIQDKFNNLKVKDFIENAYTDENQKEKKVIIPIKGNVYQFVNDTPCSDEYSIYSKTGEKVGTYDYKNDKIELNEVMKQEDKEVEQEQEQEHEYEQETKTEEKNEQEVSQNTPEVEEINEEINEEEKAQEEFQNEVEDINKSEEPNLEENDVFLTEEDKEALNVDLSILNEDIENFDFTNNSKDNNSKEEKNENYRNVDNELEL